MLLAALPKNFGSLMFLRIVHAFGSAAVMSMGAGTVADVSICCTIWQIVYDLADNASH